VNSVGIHRERDIDIVVDYERHFVFPAELLELFGFFKKGAFMLADELQLPVVPLTINGSFDVMPRMKDWHFAHWHPLSLTIHQPVYPVGQGPQNIQATMNQAYDSVMSALEPKYQGFVENPDQ
jgi:1-acyl-sn-glycerol-3-phosphate acyltransferase